MNIIKETLQLLLLRQGKRVEFNDRAVLLHFWDQTCPKCIEDMPTIIDTIKSPEYKSIFFLGICVNEDGYTEKDLKKYNLSWPQVSVKWDSFLTDSLGISSIPTVVIIDQKNTITYSDSISNMKRVLDRLKTNG